MTHIFPTLFLPAILALSACAAAPIAEAEDWLRHHRRLWNGRLDRLSALAAHIEQENENG